MNLVKGTCEKILRRSSSSETRTMFLLEEVCGNFLRRLSLFAHDFADMARIYGHRQGSVEGWCMADPGNTIDKYCLTLLLLFF